MMLEITFRGDSCSCLSYLDVVTLLLLQLLQFLQPLMRIVALGMTLLILTVVSGINDACGKR